MTTTTESRSKEAGAEEKSYAHSLGNVLADFSQFVEQKLLAEGTSSRPVFAQLMWSVCLSVSVSPKSEKGFNAQVDGMNPGCHAVIACRAKRHLEMPCCGVSMISIENCR